MTKELQWGLISKLDGATISKTLERILLEFEDEFIKTTEVGIFNGQTSRSINDYIISAGRKNIHTAIDSQKDKPVLLPFDDCRLIIGNSIEVYNELPDNSQHFIFIDACHSFPMTIADFYCYQDKVMEGGYIAFHDTGKHIEPFTSFQFMGITRDADMYISCRKALDKVGLLKNKVGGWRMIFDEADPEDQMGGVTVFKKYALWD